MVGSGVTTAGEMHTRRRQLIWLLLAGSVAVAIELQRPALKETPKLPACEPLPNPYARTFDPAFGLGVGMQCGNPDLPASPKVVIQEAPLSVTVAPAL
ncbi:MAG: hypothetical protein WA864_11720 [Acetobacteraceae bacterium]